MKRDRYNPPDIATAVKLTKHPVRRHPAITAIAIACCLTSSSLLAETDESTTGVPRSNVSLDNATDEPPLDPQADALMQHAITRLANGSAFDAKLRQRVWTSGREVLGVGTYLQAGLGLLICLACLGLNVAVVGRRLWQPMA